MADIMYWLAIVLAPKSAQFTVESPDWNVPFSSTGTFHYTSRDICPTAQIAMLGTTRHAALLAPYGWPVVQNFFAEVTWMSTSTYARGLLALARE